MGISKANAHSFAHLPNTTIPALPIYCRSAQ